MYLLRLDDASEYMDCEKWGRVEAVLKKYSIRPLVGIVPCVHDSKIMTENKIDLESILQKWKRDGWELALHGYDHVLHKSFGGLNPVNDFSEFVGLPLEEQKKRIRGGYVHLKQMGVEPRVFFAPSHTFDDNTLIAIRETTPIRIISDTIANDVYFQNGFYFIPQQSGKVRNLPFRITTICLHPGNMTTEQIRELDNWCDKHKDNFVSFDDIELKTKSLNLYDRILRLGYMLKNRR